MQTKSFKVLIVLEFFPIILNLFCLIFNFRFHYLYHICIISCHFVPIHNFISLLVMPILDFLFSFSLFSSPSVAATSYLWQTSRCGILSCLCSVERSWVRFGFGFSPGCASIVLSFFGPGSGPRFSGNKHETLLSPCDLALTWLSSQSLLSSQLCACTTTAAPPQHHSATINLCLVATSSLHSLQTAKPTQKMQREKKACTRHGQNRKDRKRGRQREKENDNGGKEGSWIDAGLLGGAAP